VQKSWKFNVKVVFYYRQHCAQRNAAGIKFTRADFEVFRPAGATRCTDGGGIWHGRGTVPPRRAKFHPNRCNGKGIGPPKLKFLLRFDQNVEYKRPSWAYPLRDFYKICRLCTPFQDTLAVKISLDLINWLCSYGVLS